MKIPHHYDYGSTYRQALQVNWQVEDLIGGDKRLDFEKSFLPEVWVDADQLDFLSEGEKLLVNHIRSHSYLSLFGFVEEFIAPFVVDHVRDRIHTGTPEELRALLHFAEEEVKHIQLFQRFGEEFRAGSGYPCDVLGSPAAVAAAVLSKSPLGVALAILHIEWMTLLHYVSSVRHNVAIDPQFSSLLRHHWLEEAQHAKLDTLMVESIAQTMSEQEIQQGIDDYLAIGGLLDGGLAQQTDLDLASFTRITGRTLSDCEAACYRRVQQRSYRHVPDLGHAARALPGHPDGHLPRGGEAGRRGGGGLGAGGDRGAGARRRRLTPTRTLSRRLMAEQPHQTPQDKESPMLQTRQQRSYPSVVTRLLVALAATVMAWMFTGCGFDAPPDVDTPKGINEVLNMAPVRPLAEAGRWTVYEVPGKLSVQHGYGCLGQGFAATEDYVGFRIQDSAAVPLSFGDAGTILLNGWDLQYTNGDHHVAGLGTVIFNVTETRTVDQFVLNWEAGGVLSDKNGDDGYRWCYRYTLVFWNRGAFDAVVPLQTDVATTFVEVAGPSSGTALLDLPGHFPTPPYAGPHAVVPRGFGLSWRDTDHQVLQVGFDLGPATPVIAGNEITWTSQTLLKDDEPVDTYFGAEFVTVLSGQNVELWQPRTVLHLTGTSWVEEPTELNLRPDDSSCDGFVAPEESLEFYAVEKVPFDYAIPVLTGWDLSYVCPDHNVERIGVYLVEFDYVKDPTADTGTLHYTVFSTLRDDSDHGHAARYKVSILGLNGLGGGSKEEVQ